MNKNILLSNRNQGFCFVSGCPSGTFSDNKYRKLKGLPLPYLFQPPKDPGLFQLWQTIIPTSDHPLSANDFVCELHFAENHVYKYYKAVMPDGTIEQIERVKPALKCGSIPCKFPPISTANQKNFQQSETGNGQDSDVEFCDDPMAGQTEIDDRNDQLEEPIKEEPELIAEEEEEEEFDSPAFEALREPQIEFPDIEIPSENTSINVKTIERPIESIHIYSNLSDTDSTTSSFDSPNDHNVLKASDTIEIVEEVPILSSASNKNSTNQTMNKNESDEIFDDDRNLRVLFESLTNDKEQIDSKATAVKEKNKCRNLLKEFAGRERQPNINVIIKKNENVKNWFGKYQNKKKKANAEIGESEILQQSDFTEINGQKEKKTKNIVEELNSVATSSNSDSKIDVGSKQKGNKVILNLFKNLTEPKINFQVVPESPSSNLPKRIETKIRSSENWNQVLEENNVLTPENPNETEEASLDDLLPNRNKNERNLKVIPKNIRHPSTPDNRSNSMEKNQKKIIANRNQHLQKNKLQSPENLSETETINRDHLYPNRNTDKANFNVKIMTSEKPSTNSIKKPENKNQSSGDWKQNLQEIKVHTLGNLRSTKTSDSKDSFPKCYKDKKSCNDLPIEPDNSCSILNTMHTRIQILEHWEQDVEFNDAQTSESPTETDKSIPENLLLNVNKSKENYNADGESVAKNLDQSIHENKEQESLNPGNLCINPNKKKIRFTLTGPTPTKKKCVQNLKRNIEENQMQTPKDIIKAVKTSPGNFVQIPDKIKLNPGQNLQQNKNDSIDIENSNPGYLFQNITDSKATVKLDTELANDDTIFEYCRNFQENVVKSTPLQITTKTKKRVVGSLKGNDTNVNENRFTAAKRKKNVFKNQGKSTTKSNDNFITLPNANSDDNAVKKKLRNIQPKDDIEVYLMQLDLAAKQKEDQQASTSQEIKKKNMGVIADKNEISCRLTQNLRNRKRRDIVETAAPKLPEYTEPKVSQSCQLNYKKRTLVKNKSIKKLPIRATKNEQSMCYVEVLLTRDKQIEDFLKNIQNGNSCKTIDVKTLKVYKMADGISKNEGITTNTIQQHLKPPIDIAEEVTANNKPLFENLKDNLNSIQTPHKQWVGAFIPGTKEIIFTEWDINYTPLKKIIIKEDLTFKVLFGKKVISVKCGFKAIRKFAELENVLMLVGKMMVCKGVENKRLLQKCQAVVQSPLIAITNLPRLYCRSCIEFIKKKKRERTIQNKRIFNMTKCLKYEQRKNARLINKINMLKKKVREAKERCKLVEKEAMEECKKLFKLSRKRKYE